MATAKSALEGTANVSHTSLRSFAAFKKSL
jgi:hypothetical protein